MSLQAGPLCGYGLPVEVGIGELRAGLSRFIRRVREGEEIVVTDRGKAVARIVLLDGQRKVDRLIAAGIVKPAKRRTDWLPDPIDAEGTVSDLIER
jgi:prevent-host-death family protein